jgi:hypothetical protein
MAPSKLALSPTQCALYALRRLRCRLNPEVDISVKVPTDQCELVASGLISKQLDSSRRMGNGGQDTCLRMRVGKCVQAVKCERVEGRQPLSMFGDELSNVGGAHFNPGRICMIR